MSSDISFDADSNEIIRLMEESSMSVLITGRAGTGKSTLLDHFRFYTKKNVAVLAPTGVAAVNVRGQTIHSFFGFKPDITPDAIKIGEKGRGLYEKLDAIVIDEVSMVRADLFDCMDRFLRLARSGGRNVPFGGVQMILIGDLYQLPPVVTGTHASLFNGGYYATPYFFSSHAFAELPVVHRELMKVYRQKDEIFIGALSALRTGAPRAEDLALLNTRHTLTGPPENAMFLVSTNAQAEDINARRLLLVHSPLLKWRGQIQGEFPEDRLPTHLELELKLGAQVMLLSNDREGRWINGDIGILEGSEGSDREEILWVRLSSKKRVPIKKNSWEIVRFALDEASGRIVSHVVASFLQFPLKLAWAVTIHKSQGKTFDQVVIDFGRGTFASGQAYVALSRCRTLAGMTLVRPLERKHVIVDPRIHEFISSLSSRVARGQTSLL